MAEWSRMISKLGGKGHIWREHNIEAEIVGSLRSLTHCQSQRNSRKKKRKSELNHTFNQTGKIFLFFTDHISADSNKAQLK